MVLLLKMTIFTIMCFILLITIISGLTQTPDHKTAIDHRPQPEHTPSTAGDATHLARDNKRQLMALSINRKTVESKEFKSSYSVSPQVVGGLKRVLTPFKNAAKPWLVKAQLAIGNNGVQSDSLPVQPVYSGGQQNIVHQEQHTVNVGVNVSCCRRWWQRLQKAGVNILGLGHLYGTGSIAGHDYPFQYR